MKKNNNKYDYDISINIDIDEWKKQVISAIYNNITITNGNTGSSLYAIPYWLRRHNPISKVFEDIDKLISLIYVNEKKQEVGIKWSDGTITKGICQGEDEFDVEIGFLMALKKKIFKSDKKLHEFILSKLPNDEKQIEIVNRDMKRKNE